MAEPRPSKPMMRVRFPSAALPSRTASPGGPQLTRFARDRLRRRGNSPSLLPHDLDHESPGAPPVDLAVEDLLPGAKIEAPARGRTDDRRADAQARQLRV